jgi:hypothetical protein
MNSNLYKQLEQAINQGNYENSVYIANQIMNSDGKIIINTLPSSPQYYPNPQSIPANYNQTFTNIAYPPNYNQTYYAQSSAPYAPQPLYSQANPPYQNQPYYSTSYPTYNYK